MLRGIVLAIIMAAFGLGLLGGSFIWGMERLFRYAPPDPSPFITSQEGDQRTQDAAYFAHFPGHDRSYSASTREEAGRLIAVLKGEAKNLSLPAFHLRIAEIAALADNAHTSLAVAEMRKFTNALPIRLYWFLDGLHIVRAKAECEQLLGARIDQIEGLSIEALFARLKKYIGGPEQFRRSRLPLLLESPELLHEAGIAERASAIRLSGAYVDGTPLEIRLGALPAPGEIPTATRHILFSVSEAVEQQGWRSLMKRGSSAPVSLAGAPRLFRLSKIPTDGLYLGLAANSSSKDEDIAAFLEGAEAAIREGKPRFVVVDLRFNGGGDYTNTYSFASGLPILVGPEARIYVLTSGWTLSAAMTTTGALKQAGGKQVMIVGEPVGDRLRFYAEGNDFCLPNSGACLHYATALHDYTAFCADLTECYWLNYFYPVRIASLDPEIYSFLTFEDYRKGRDPALEAVFAREGGMLAAALASE